MLQDFRDNLKGTAVFIVVLISIPFALVGIDQIFFTGNAVESALRVNGEDITKLEVERALALHKQRLLDQYVELDPASLDDELLRGPVQERLIREIVLAQHAKTGGLGVADATISSLLKNASAFQVDGQFDRDVFEFSLQQMGYTKRSYHDFLQRSLLVSQTIDGLTDTAFVPTATLTLTAELLEQKRNYYYLKVPIADQLPSVSISETAITDYYEDHTDDFQTPEQVVLEYVELRAEDLLKDVAVTEDMVREQYKIQQQKRLDLARHRVAHILFAADDENVNQSKADEVREKLSAGATFAELAKQYSDDSGSADQGGDLGYVQAETLPSAFMSTVQQLNVGEVSAPIATDSGMHLIKLLERDEPDAEGYAEAAPRIRRRLELELAEELLPERIEELREAVYNAETLAIVAEDMHLTRREIGPFSRSGGDGLAANPAIVRAAFQADVLLEGHASEVIELDATTVVVVKLKEHHPIRTLSLAEVHENIADKLKLEKARALTIDKGEALREKVLAGESVESVAKAAGLSWQVSVDTKRFGGNVDDDVRNYAFAQPVNSTLPLISTLTNEAGDVYVLSLTGITPGSLDELPPEQRNSLRNSLRSALAQREYQAFEASLVALADIDY